MKANVGHMETVSGVAGLIKVVLMMQHDEIAPQTHFESLNPHIKLDGTRLVIPTEHVAVAARRAAADRGRQLVWLRRHEYAFDCRGAAEPQCRRPTSRDRVDRPLHVLKLSAKTEAALAAAGRATCRRIWHEHPDDERRRRLLVGEHGPGRFQSPRGGRRPTDAKQLQRTTGEPRRGRDCRSRR